MPVCEGKAQTLVQSGHSGFGVRGASNREEKKNHLG